MSNVEHLPPVARNSDPSTSKQSAVELDESGQQARDISRVRRALYRWPGFTARELANQAGLPHEMTWKRLSDLKNAGEALAPDERKRRCSVSGRLTLTWYPNAVNYKRADFELEQQEAA